MNADNTFCLVQNQYLLYRNARYGGDMLGSSGDRLKYAIERRGFDSVAAFARAVNEKAVTVRQHINRGSVPKEVAEKYARRLKVSLDWLLYGKGTNPFTGKDSDLSPGSTSGLSIGSADGSDLKAKIESGSAEEQALDLSNGGNEEVRRHQLYYHIMMMLREVSIDTVEMVHDTLSAAPKSEAQRRNRKRVRP